MEKAVYLVLREGANTALAVKALTVLREQFIDWNDVRASRPSELARLISGSTKSAPQRRVLERCQRVRELIDQVYNDRNEPSKRAAKRSPKECAWSASPAVRKGWPPVRKG